MSDTTSVESIFFAALQKESPAERAAYLDQACGGDVEVRRQVEQLLAAHPKVGHFLEQPAAPPAGNTGPFAPSAAPAPPLAVGSVVAGKYKLRERLGEGGMGVVYVADQTQPVQRRVALKLVKAGLDSAAALARFEQERQALALMDHPHIAKVLDAGSTDAGQPFFVMELVKGIPITRFCDQEKLSPKERLELFIPVCQAVQHAHQKGIIHRDLKPANILIGLYDGTPVPKVIDFGVAKTVGPRLSEQSVYTQVGTMVGTLEYMAPEQAELDNMDIDTRADIYALGVVLYELLTGSVPFPRKQLQAAGLSGMLRVIKEMEPPRPSTRLSSSGDLPALAAVRKLEPKRLARLVRGDLDWIAMKCLEKERSRRYESANGLAMDLQRYLADEPVLAGPPGAGYRLRKFARKHRKPLAAAAAFVALLLGAVGVSAWQAMRATRAEEKARTERDAAVRARESADRNFALAKDAVDKYLSKVTDNPKLKEADFNQLRKELLETALPFYQKLADQEGQDPDLRAARGQAYFRLAVLREDMGDRETALADCRRAVEVLEPLTAEFPAVAPYRQALAEGLSKSAALLGELSRPVEAEAQHRQAVTFGEQLVTERPAVPEYRANLADRLSAYGILLTGLGRLAEAEAQYRKALDLLKNLAADYPTVASYQRNVGGALNNLSLVLDPRNRLREAIDLLEQAIRYQRRALDLDPRDAQARRFLFSHHINAGMFLTQINQRDQAVDHHRQALDVIQKLAAEFPTVPRYRDMLGTSHNALALLLSDAGRWDEAAAEHRRALDLREKLATDFPTVGSYHREMAGSMHNLATVLERTGQRAEALVLYQRALRREGQALEREPENDLAHQYLTEHHLCLGRLLARLGRRAEAEVHLRQALAVAEKKLKGPDAEWQRPRFLAQGHSRLARLLAELGRWDKADAHGRQALALQDKGVTESPDFQDYTIDRAVTYATLGDLVRDRGRPSEALDWYAKAIAALEPVLAKDKRRVEAREALRDALAGRARALDRLGRHAEAVPDWQRAQEMDSGPDRPVFTFGLAVSQALGSGDHAAAFAAAETLAKDGDAPTLEAFARLCARVSGASGEQYAARAVELLRQALARGYHDTLYLQEGADLAPLRGRQDFQQLLNKAGANE
jgi:serine/threonine protein kinase/tetratricopeptide (TPR) repeat protein